MRRSSSFLVVLTACSLLVTGCDDDAAAPPPSMDGDIEEDIDEDIDDGAETPTGTDRTSPSPPATAAGDVPALREFCLLQPGLAQIEHIEFAYPEGWRVEDDDCEFFDPKLRELEPGTEPDAAISVRVADVAFPAVAEPGRETRDEIQYVGAISGYQAVRITGEATGQGQRQEGEPVLRYLVDLDPQADEDGGTLILNARPSAGADFKTAADALDRVARTVRIVPPAVDGRDPIVVTRVEGGRPYAVTYAGECFRLHLGAPTDPVADEACDLDPSDGISGTILGTGEFQVVAGFAPPVAELVVSHTGGVPYGAFTTPVEGAAAFAYEALDDPIEVDALAQGERIATATIE